MRENREREAYDAGRLAGYEDAADDALSLMRIARAVQAWRDKPYATNADPEWREVCDALMEYGEDRLR